MADKKQSFIIYEDWANFYFALPDELKIDFMNAVLSKGSGREYEIKNDAIRAYFDGVVAADMDRNKESRERYRMEQAERGRKGAEAKKDHSKQMVANASEGKQVLATASDRKQTVANASEGKQVLATASDRKQTVANASEGKQVLATASDRKQTVANASEGKRTSAIYVDGDVDVNADANGDVDADESLQSIPTVSPSETKEKAVRETTSLSQRKRAVFHPPDVEEVREYCRSRNNSIDAEEFVDFYASKGWKVGKDKMTDWKAAVRTWEHKRSKDNRPRDSTYMNAIRDRVNVVDSWT